MPICHLLRKGINMKRIISTALLICLCALLLCGCAKKTSWVAEGSDDYPIFTLKSWLNPDGEVSSLEYTAHDGTKCRTYSYLKADNEISEVTDGVPSYMPGDSNLTVKEMEQIYADVCEWAPGHMEDSATPGLSISYICPRFAFLEGAIDSTSTAYVYSMASREITQLDGEYTGSRDYGTISGGYPVVVIYIDD